MAEKTSYTIEQLAEDERATRALHFVEAVHIPLTQDGTVPSQQIDPEVEPDVEVDGEASDPASPPESPQVQPPVAPIITPVIEPVVEVPAKEGV